MKICKVCNQEKEYSEFAKHKNMKDGHLSTCKKCKAEYQKQYGAKNKNKKKIYDDKYREDNKEHLQELSKIYREKNKDSIKKKKKMDYEKNKDSIKKKARKWYNENKEYTLKQQKELHHKRACKYKNIINNMFNSDIKTITYILTSDNFCKIGFTTNLYIRLKDLRIIPNQIFILNKNIEKRLLRELSNHRCLFDNEFEGYTECFNISKDLLDHIIVRESFKEFKKED